MEWKILYSYWCYNKKKELSGCEVAVIWNVIRNGLAVGSFETLVHV